MNATRLSPITFSLLVVYVGPCPRPDPWRCSGRLLGGTDISRRRTELCRENVAHARRATARAAAAGDQPGLYPACGSAHGDVVLPQLHTVVEFALPKEFALLGNPALLRTPIGQETVNGIATTKYTIEEALPGGHIAGSLWLSRDGIPMRCDGRFEPDKGRRSTIYWELRDVKLGKQDEALFEVPKGYKKLPPDAVAPLLGMHLAAPPAH